MKTVGAVGNVQYRKAKEERSLAVALSTPSGSIPFTKTYPNRGSITLDVKGVVNYIQYTQ